jgi:uncharacterized RDD family membrane protein YckC
MICPLCNKPYPCVHSRDDQGVSDAGAVKAGQAGVRPPSASLLAPPVRVISGVEAHAVQAPAIEAPGVEALSRADRALWRHEVALRVRQHRARRRRYDPNASLDLDFPSDAALAVAPERSLSAPEFSEHEPVFALPMHELEPEATEKLTIPEGSGHANDMVEPEPDANTRLLGARAPSPANDAFPAGEGASTPPREARVGDPGAPRPSPRKVIRFPRYAAVEPVIVQRPPIVEIELAEPAPEAPRILEAPEPEATQMELLPSFADIRLEEAPPAVDLCRELESAPKPASLGRRFASGAVDSGIVLFAAGLFAAIFIQIAESAPSGRSMVFFIAGVGAALWLLFQYLFLVYGAATPGMRATQLELFSFNGKRPSRFARRIRVAAALLSAASVGLGFAWALVDEDTLGWHDRISQTYVKQ